MKSLLLIVCLAASLGVALLAQAAGNAAAGKSKAEECAGCHGDRGEGLDGPKISGKTESDFLQAMRDYKSGKRQDAVMKDIASKLSDQDLADLAAYYASMR